MGVKWFRGGSQLPGTTGRETPLLDVWRTDYADLWFRLVPSYSYYGELEVELCGEAELGFCSGAFEFEINEFGYETWFTDTLDLRWALSEGIAPRQPFLIRLYPPVYTKCWGDYGYDYDGTAEWELKRVQYWPRSVSLRYWDRFLRSVSKANAAKWKVHHSEAA